MLFRSIVAVDAAKNAGVTAAAKAAPAILRYDGSVARDGTSFHDGGYAVAGASTASIVANQIAPVIWTEVRKDVKSLTGAKTGQPAFATPLWHDGENPFADGWQTVRTAWAATDDRGWQFWIDWYEAVLDGRPLLGDWDRHWTLLTDIALISDHDWNAGPDKVNPLIGAAHLRHIVRKQAEDLLADHHRLRALEFATRHPPRDHNNPPEILALDPKAYDDVERASGVARAAVEEMRFESQLDRPNPVKLRESADRLSAALTSVLKYLGGKADLAIETLIKWGVPAGVVWMLTNQDKLAAFLLSVRSLPG